MSGPHSPAVLYEEACAELNIHPQRSILRSLMSACDCCRDWDTLEPLPMKVDVSQSVMGAASVRAVCRTIRRMHRPVALAMPAVSLTNAGVVALCAELEGTSTVQSIDLRGNGGLTGLAGRALIAFVENHPCLKRVMLQGTGLTASVVSRIEKKCQDNEECRRMAPRWVRAPTPPRGDGTADVAVVATTPATVPPRAPADVAAALWTSGGQHFPAVDALCRMIMGME